MKHITDLEYRFSLAASSAYLAFLRSRDVRFRIKHQAEMCALRDVLALYHGWSSEATQNYYEKLAQDERNEEVQNNH